MKNANNLPTRPTLRGLVLALAVTALSSYVAEATPYASAVTNDSGTIRFILNEDADDVGVAFDNATATNNLGALSKGPNSFSLGGHTNFSIYVTKTGTGIPSVTSVDTNRWVNFWGPRGLTVNRNPKTYNFGRIYVVNANGGTQPLGGISDTNGTRTVTRGIYAINADQTDAVGQGDDALTFGMNLASSTTYSPYRISVGEDDMVYVADAAGSYIGGTVSITNGVWMVQPDLSSGVNLFPIDGSVPEICGGVEGTPVALGSYAAGNLVLYALSWDLSPYQTVWRYDINGASLPYTTAPTQICNAGISAVQGVLADMAIGPDGKIYTTEPRSTPGSGNIIIHVFDSSGTPLWDSWNNWGAVNGDPYVYSSGIAISSDGKLMATVVRNTGNFAITQLTNGIPDPSTFTLTTTGLGGTAVGIAFDAADNVYVAPSSLAILRVYSLGISATAVTSNDSTGTNGTFQLLLPSTSVSVAATTDTTSMDTTQPPGVFTLTRTGDTGPALPVGYSLSGTATNGVQYQTLSGTVTFQPGAASTNVFVTAIPYSPAGPTRSVILSIISSNKYAAASPVSATVWIVDTNTPSIHIGVRDAQFYERTNDYARFTLTRWGNTNVYLSQVNVTYGGTATEGTQFYGDANTFMSYGEQTKDVQVYPIHDGVFTGPLTVTATVAPAGDNSYDVGTPATSGGITRVDADDPPETVLWSDNFSTDSSANWTVRFATTNDAPADYCLNALPDFASLPQIGTWPFDYSVLGVPSAPHTTDGTTLGLYMAVNKNDGQPAAAALNLYPNGQSFSGNYALRFDMFLIENDTASTTEYALFGINHDGTHTNWFRNSTFGFDGVDPTGWNFDGVFYDVEADGSALGDYVGYSSPTTANHNPTAITPGRNASTLTGIFKSPPWTPGGSGGGAAANVYGSATPIWADVELAQINGVIYWYINHTLIFSYTNTTPYAGGDVMLGYEDGYDSIGSSGGSVIYANARVISLAGPYITQIVLNGANAEITFTANPSDVVGQFVLQSASTANGTYGDTSSTITSLGGGSFKAVKAASGSPTFYRIRRIY